MEYTNNDVFELKDELKEAKSIIRALSKSTEDNEVKINELLDRLDTQEDFSRRKNIRINGIQEIPEENKEKLQAHVQKIFQDKLQLKDISISTIHRLSDRKNVRSYPRTVIARLTKEGDCRLLLRNTWRLKNII